MDFEGKTAGHGRPADRWWRSLAARAALAMGCVLVGLSCLLVFVNASTVDRSERHQIDLTAAREAGRVAHELAGGPADPQLFARLVRAEPFEYAFLESADGAVIAGSAPAAAPPRPSAGRLDETGDSAVAVVTSAGGVAHVSKTLRLAGGERATLRVGLSYAPAEAAAATSAVRGLVAALAFLALALPVLAFAVDRVASPLRDLTRAVTRPGSAQAAVKAAGARRDEVGALVRAHLSITRDLAERADALHHLTFDDPLTGLPNRASLTSKLAVALQLGQPVALLQFEVQGLSRVAAGLGQAHGDEAIRHAAERLSEVTRDWARRADVADERRVLARGSDTGFALLLRGAGCDEARALADVAVTAFETPLQVGEHHVTTTLSVGVAIAPEDGDEAGALLRSASAAVSAARAAGPQTVRFAGAELNRMAYGRLKLEQELRRAIDGGELELHYQPQISLRTGAVSGVEALVRWRHPTRGMVSPGEFVPLAEECGLIEPLGRWVLAEASRVAAAWRVRGLDVRVAVNVSTIQFKRQHFAETTLGVIRAAGADPSDIELEITESAAMGDPEHAARELAPLKAAGVRVAIDDFGTGYSNLAALTRLPFDVLKIDRGFVRDADGSAGARIVVGTVIGMAENLGFETVAEGVETADQLDFVTGHGCTHAQGFLFGRPMPQAAFELWYADRRVAELRSLGARGVGRPPIALAG